VGPASISPPSPPIAGVVLLLPLIEMRTWGVGNSSLGLLALLGIVPAIDAAIALVNRAITRGRAATILPGLSLREGIPAHLRTMVVVPTLLTTRAAIEQHIERLEIHYLASPDGELHFALLSDWTDAPAEHAAGDTALLDVAIEGIARLNRVHGAPPPATASCCFIGGGSGARGRSNGWAGSASAANCTN
jgi:cyclic beta-1,2-glucan synthetase